jgi:cell division protease FtsH
VRVNQQFYKNMALWVVILVMILLLVTMLRQGETPPPEFAYSDFLTRVEAGEVQSVLIEEGQIRGQLSDGSEFSTYAPSVTEELLAKLRAQNVEISARPKPEGSVWRQILMMWFPMLLIIGLWVFFIRQMQAGGGKAMSFGKSRARLLTENQHQVTFEDVAGVEESKFELEEIIAFLREPKKFTRLGGRIPKGVLLVGPPGTGKTLLARAVAGEAGVPFYSISGSDFVEMFVGVGASRVRDLFLQGKKNAPCIVFIDEIDAVGRHRGAGLGGGHDEREQTLNQLLVEMDGFESNEGVILIAATNRPDVLDPALLRPGRFDRRVVVPRPDLRGRLAVLKVHTRRVALSDDVELAVLARGTPGFVGADLQNLVNEAALLAARRDADKVSMIDFEEAKDKVLMGAARKSLIMSDEDRRATAYHEAGHALVAMLTPGADPVHKVTIIPRGMALGVTMTMPEEDRYTLTHQARHGRSRRGGGGLRPLLDRRRQRSQAGHRIRAPDGVQLRDERADRPDVAGRQRRRRVPRARFRDAQGLQREEDAGGGRGDRQHPAHAVRRGPADARREPRRAGPDQRIAARARDAGGRGAQDPDRGPDAAPAAVPGREQEGIATGTDQGGDPQVDPPRQAPRPGARSRLGAARAHRGDLPGPPRDDRRDPERDP